MNQMNGQPLDGEVYQALKCWYGTPTPKPGLKQGDTQGLCNKDAALCIVGKGSITDATVLMWLCDVHRKVLTLRGFTVKVCPNNIVPVRS